MTQPIPTEYNPFMLLLDPAAVLAAVEKSERLGRLNRHLCRPLDRPTSLSAPPADAADAADEGDGSDAVGVGDEADAIGSAFDEPGMSPTRW